MSDKKETTSKRIQLKGTFEWARIFEENRDMVGANGAYESCDGACSIDLLMDEENLQLLKDSGSQKWKKPTEKGADENGLYRVNFVRKWKAPYTYGGAPQVAHADGSAWSLEDDGLVGNGSSGIIYATVYEAKGLKGTRLDAVQVLEHVEYVTDSDYVPGVKFKDYSDGDEAKGVETKAKSPKDLGDEIPF